ncbi:hypothetical protein GCM10011507_00010 [Edaphobacter acidisoli]|uniref:Uncharacterized protein n=1 Tax=Edaphobacter acidisoli TaxID=2040573 RepID=A0A916RDG0_9BACT|nr:hypothetical protein [Edaphobacter acidisoli]GGA52958.1 hypothetical protein GCM10011507_00010 [Edaphobacter acidisoli]
MKKPVGIILSAIVLILVGIFCLLMSLTMAFAGVIDNPIAASATPMPHLFTFLMVGIAIFYLAIATWMGITAYGILRLRRWARYSILVISACIAFFSLMSVFGIAVSYFAMPQLPGANPHVLAIAFLAIALFELVFTAIGTWLFVYFIRRPIRELFDAANLLPLEPYPNLNLPHDGTYATPPPPLVYPAAPYKTYTGFFSSPSHAPAAIKVLGWIFLVGALFIVPWIFAPFPGFMFGMIIPQPESHLMFLAFAVLGACIGYGLLKLKNWSRLTAIALIVVGFINYAVCLLPQAQNQLRVYSAVITAHITSLVPAVPGQPKYLYTYPTSMLFFGIAVGLVINLVVLWLLLHYRSAFTTPSEPQTESV